jgi:hypothetical protein
MDDIYVGNIPQGTKYDDIRKLFEIHGEISRIKMHKTFAFVSYTNKAIVKDVINTMSETTLHNVLLNIKPARKCSGCIDILVSFLAQKPKIKVTEQAIETVFSEYGYIREIDIRKWIYDQNTELCKGYAFVRYNHVTNHDILQRFRIVVDDVEYSVTPSNRSSPCHLYQETTPNAYIYYNDQYNPFMGYNMNHRYFWTANIRNLH